MKLSFKDRGLISFDASAVAMEAADLSGQYGEAHGRSGVRVASLDISRNSIHTFLGARFLPHLETMDASHNALRSVMNLPASLVRLDVSYNCIGSLVGLDTCVHLQVLVASNNEVVELGRLPSSLQVLDLSSNALTSAEGMSHLIHVTKLHLHNNNIQNIAALAPLGGMKSLRHLTVSDNPVTAMHARLFHALESSIPKLTTLDGLPLTQAQASLAHRAALRKKEAESARLRTQAVRVATFHADAAGTVDSAVEQELRTLEARVKELECIARGQYDAEMRARKECGLVKRQLHRTEEIAQEQQRQMATLRSLMERDRESVASLERTHEALQRAFEQQHALIIAKKLER